MSKQLLLVKKCDLNMQNSVVKHKSITLCHSHCQQLVVGGSDSSVVSVVGL